MVDDEQENPFAAPDADQKRKYQPSRDHSVHDEPHLLDEEFISTQPASVEDLKRLDIGDHVTLNESVFDEPAFSPEAAGAIPQQAATYRNWLELGIAKTSPRKSWFYAVLAGLLCGSITAAVYLAAGLRWWSSLDLFNAAWIAAVVQAGKVLLAILFVEFWPYLFKSSRQILASTAVSAFAFVLTAQLISLTTSGAMPTSWDAIGMTVLHLLTSLAVGAGLANVWRDCMSEKQSPRISNAAPMLGLATVLQLAYFWVVG